jgi:hypothetical protein
MYVYFGDNIYEINMHHLLFVSIKKTDPCRKIVLMKQGEKIKETEIKNLEDHSIVRNLRALQS